jgi:WD40 repeat protein
MVPTMRMTHQQVMMLMTAWVWCRQVWDLESGSLLHTLEGHTDKVTQLRGFASAGKVYHVASQSQDGTLRLWAPEEGLLLHTLEGPLGMDLVQYVEGEGEGRRHRLAWVSGEGTLFVYDLGEAA